MSSSDPGAATSMRRMATVVSSVPDASNAASMTSRLGAPPVPMINREPNSLPAMINRSTSLIGNEPVARPRSTTLHRRDNLHLRPFPELDDGVLAPWNHLTIHRDGNATRSRRTLWQVEYVAKSSRRHDLAWLAVDVDDHRVRPPAREKRSRVNGATMLSSSPLMINDEITSAVIGVSSTPLR